jgi:maltose-binding protein MalE
MKFWKQLMLVALLVAGCAVTSIAQQAAAVEAPAKQKPSATYQVGSAKITVWENKRPDGSTWKNFVVEKVYRKNGEWHTAKSFDEGELLELKAAVDKAIAGENIPTGEGKEED